MNFSEESAPSRPDWRGLCLHHIFEAAAARTPGAAAISMEGETLAYEALNSRANRIAHHLISLGAGPERIVALHLERSPDLIAAMLGILKSGAAYVPVDPSYPPERIALILNDSGAHLVLTGSNLARNIPSASANIICLDSDHDEIAKSPADNPATGVQPENLAYIIYTSGSTGKPKGVMVTHRNVVRLFENAQPHFGFSGEDVWTHFHSYSFGFSVWEIWGALLFGGRLAVVPNRIAASPDEFYKLLSIERVTVLSQTPSYFRQLVRAQEHLAADHELGLRYIVFSGEPLDLQGLRPWIERNGDEQPQLVNMYAITETSGEVAYRRITEDDLTLGARSIIGKPLADIELHILGEDLKPVPDGEPGEMFIGGEALARGYKNLPELTAQKFIPNPFKPGAEERLYRTGDRVRRLAGGDIEFLGRVDHQVKIRGYRVELGEIEAVLTEHEGVDEAAVVLGTDASGEPRLAAYYVPAAEGWARIRRTAESGEMELWPSVGQYQLYDELLYHIMSTEEKTSQAYRDAIRNSVRDTIVVDIGTGGEAIFARLAAEAGAKKVYAIELLPDAAERARALVRNLGLTDKIEVIQGDSVKVNLPEKADVAIERIFGNIGSADGVVRVMNDARRYLKENAVCIPSRCVTRIAGACLPESFRAQPGFTGVSAKYVQRVFDHLGHELDLRLCVRNFPIENLLSERAIFEELDFARGNPAEYQNRATLKVSSDGLLDGFLLWTELETPGGGRVSYLENQNGWLPVYFPVFDPPIEVRAGDYIELEMSCAMSPNGVNPEYKIEGKIIHADGNARNFAHASFHDRHVFRASPFYRRIFRDSARRAAKPAVTILREHLKTFLPDYMIPSAFVEMQAMPLNANGKLDRAALPAPDPSRPELGQEYVEPQTPLEKALADMWKEVLGIERVGIYDNFFDLGGHSIKALYLSNRIQSKLGEYFYLIAIFDAPTIAQQIEYLYRHYPNSAARLTAAGMAMPSSNGTSTDEKKIGDAEMARFRAAIPVFKPLARGAGERKNARAVFVLTPPRSGSTLLRVLLAGSPRLFSPPEFELLSFNTLRERRGAFTGRDSYWLEGTIRAIMEIKRCPADEAKRIMAELEERDMTVKEFYGLVQEWIAPRTLVEKSTYYALDVNTIRRVEDDFENPLYIHLLRHPCGMINSYEEIKLHFFYRYEHSFTPRQLAELIWTACHRNILEFLAEIPPERQYKIRFEEMVAQPDRVMADLCSHFGFEFRPEMADPYAHPENRMLDGVSPESVMLGDVKFHRHNRVDPASAERWREHLSADILGDASRNLARQLGYELGGAQSGGDELTRLLVEIESLSDDEARRLLAQGEGPASPAAR